MPVKPCEKRNIGAIIAPALCDYLGDVLNAKKVLTVNLIHSYNDSKQFLSRYLDDVESFGIEYDAIFKDIDYCSEILNIIKDMLDIGIIKTGTETILRCECGRVELSYNGVRKKNNASLYTMVNNKLICNCCHNECKEYKDNILYIPIENEKIKEAMITPSLLGRCVNGKNKEMAGTKFIVSKVRNTGYSLFYRGNTYFIDADFMWMNLFRFIDADEKVLICGNKQSLKIFYINYIYSIYKSQKMCYILHPFFNNINNDLFDLSSDYNLLNKLMVLFNLSWNRENCSWNDSIYSFLSKLTKPQLQYLYNTMCDIPKNIVNSEQDTSKKLEVILKYGTNLQNKNTIF